MGAAPEAPIRIRAPGRANLMGDHTDYNEGFVLPVALDQAIRLEGAPADNVVRLTSDLGDEPVEVSLPDVEGPTEGWGRYVTAVVRQLTDMGRRVRGLDGRLTSTLPAGAGLSSSAAIEVTVALAVLGETMDREEVAYACHQAENVHVGLPCGVMDQMTVALARRGHSLFIDCRTNAYEHVSMPRDLAVLMVDSGTTRELQQSGYRDRWEQCRKAAQILGVTSLRDATETYIRTKSAELGDVLARRARHVIRENERVLETRAALAANDREALPHLFETSHRSLAEDFEVTTPEIDALQRCAIEAGVIGARLTGGGFGGCVVALVPADSAQEMGRDVVARFGKERGKRVRYWTSGPADGAGTI